MTLYSPCTTNHFSALGHYNLLLNASSTLTSPQWIYYQSSTSNIFNTVLFQRDHIKSLTPPCVSGFCTSGKRSWSLDVTSSKPRPQVALPTSATRHPNASTSPTAVPRRASPTRHWLSLMSASSSLARGRRPLTPSARWTRTSTAAWWDRALRTHIFRVSTQTMHRLICDGLCLFLNSSGDPQCTSVIKSLWLKQTQSHTKQVK